jgi:hypothetical protein
LLIKPHGNGLVIQDVNSKYSIKASDLDRGLSKGKLENRFGSFEVSTHSADKGTVTKHSYTAKPLQRDADRNNLYAEFCQAMNERRAEMEKIKEKETSQYKALRKRWDKIWVDIKHTPMLRQHRKEAQAKFADKKKAELAVFRNQIKQSKDDVRNRYPFTAWNNFLQHKARQGNETALTILRSKKEKMPPERPSAITHSQTLAGTSDATLASVAKMRELFNSEGIKTEPQYTIDTKGTIIFKLPDGGFICDTGVDVHFTTHEEQAKRIATKLAQARWGQSVYLAGNRLKHCFSTTPVIQQPQSQSIDMAR